MTPSETSKTCACGIRFSFIPRKARLHTGDIAPGWYWNCFCKSTLYVPEGAMLHVTEAEAQEAS